MTRSKKNKGKKAAASSSASAGEQRAATTLNTAKENDTETSATVPKSINTTETNIASSVQQTNVVQGIGPSHGPSAMIFTPVHEIRVPLGQQFSICIQTKGGVTTSLLDPWPATAEEFEFVINALGNHVVAGLRQADAYQSQLAQTMLLSKEKAEVEKKYVAKLEECASLQKELEELKAQFASSEKTQQSLQGRVDKLERESTERNVIQYVSAWIEFARQLVIKDMMRTGILPARQVDNRNQSELWHEAMTIVDENDIYQTIFRVLGVKEEDWRVIKNFYYRLRCRNVHDRPSADDAKNALVHLPQPYLQSMAVFAQLIDACSPHDSSDISWQKA